MMDPSLVASPSLIREWRRRRHPASQQFLSPHQARTLLLPDALPRTRISSGASGRPRRLRSFISGRRLISSATDVGGGNNSSSRIRRCSSAPSTLRNKRTPPLATIPEEPTGGNNPSQTNSSNSSNDGYSPPQAGSIDYVLERHRRHFGEHLTSSSQEIIAQNEGAGSSGVAEQNLRQFP